MMSIVSVSLALLFLVKRRCAGLLQVFLLPNIKLLAQLLPAYAESSREITPNPLG